MARRTPDDPAQVGMFDDPILWWPGRPPEPRPPEETLRPPRRRETAKDSEQLALFQLPERQTWPLRKQLRHRLRGREKPQTFVELACALGLRSLQQLLQMPATYFYLDATPLQEGLRVRTLLEARYRIVAQLEEAFADVADLAPVDLRLSRFTLWGGRRLYQPGASSPFGEALSLAIGAPDERVEDPFRLRLRGLPGYLGHERGPSPLEEGEELLSLYDRETLYRLLPTEVQPMPLERLLTG